MNTIYSDLITFGGAASGVLSICYAVYQYVKSTDKYVVDSDCRSLHDEIKKLIAKEAEKRENEDSVLHEKINEANIHIANIEGKIESKLNKRSNV